MSCWMITDAHADLIATAAMTMLPEGRALIGQITGQALLVENTKSCFARYSLRHGMAEAGLEQAESYKFEPWPTPIDPDLVNAAARCADYQCCEHDGWRKSDSGRLVERLIETTGGYDREVDPYPWGIEEEHRSQFVTELAA